jgi:hypothetical protein
MCAHQVRPYGPVVTEGDRSPSTKFTADGPVPHYVLRVEGRLASRWSAWFDGLVVTTGDDGTTVISGPIADQAALHGLIQKLRDIGIPLVSLTQVPTHDAPQGD